LTRRDLLSLASMGLRQRASREFDGPHTVAEDIAREALAWFAG
jgi:hypothetical protein